tara:strand:- start:14471 stop:15199 length:729 start_codon:yes stop_codon:yes gene_type:complete
MIKPSSQLGESIMQLIAAYTNYKDPLGPGVAIQRKGAVKDFFVQQGSISFEIHDKRERAFDVEIHTTPPSENVRRAVLSGNLHEAVPKVAEIQIHHVCPDWATPCRHEIAALLQLLKECEDDPHVILKWRGIELESDSVDQKAPIKNDSSITSRKSTIQQLRDTMPGRFINFKEEKSNESVLTPDMESFFSFPKDQEPAPKNPIIKQMHAPPEVQIDGQNIFPIFEDAIETIKEFLGMNINS